MGEYADVNGVHMHFEVNGSGEPLVLLHGGFGGAHIFGGQVPELSARYRVFVPEQRGRMHTADLEGPITYQILAEDMIAFLDKIVGAPANLVGVSDGGIVGLLVAMQRPNLLRKLVMIGANFHRDGLVSTAMWTEASPDDEVWAMPRRRYEEVSPDGPDHFPVVFAKLQRMWQTEPSIEARELEGISIPVLVMVGDDDVVGLDHTVELYELLPQGQLAVIPGASHAVFMEKPALLNRMILEFLSEEGPPETILPVRRTGTA
jgi:pimeloyl-ACP methyl ester carboxylesterase